MSKVHKNLVTDEHNRPVAVQIDYADWLAIEERLGAIEEGEEKVSDLSQYAGTLSVSEDPVAYQRRIREEWR